MIGDATLKAVNFASSQKSLSDDPEIGSCVDPDPEPETRSRSSEEAHLGPRALSVVPLQNDPLKLRFSIEVVPFDSANVFIIKHFCLRFFFCLSFALSCLLVRRGGGWLLCGTAYDCTLAATVSEKLGGVVSRDLWKKKPITCTKLEEKIKTAKKWKQCNKESWSDFLKKSFFEKAQKERKINN